MEKIIRIWIIYGEDAYRSFFTELDKMPEDVKPGEIIISHLDGEIRDGKTHGRWFYKTKGGE